MKAEVTLDKGVTVMADNKACELIKKCFDYNEQVIYFPVRHHSPACSYHLLNVIKEYNPDCVLCEGPDDANFLIPYLCRDESVPPVCIYTSYDDANKIISEKGRKYRAYYPFLPYSPEYTALKCATQNNVNASFIDMPYQLMLMHSEDENDKHFFGQDETAEYYRRVTEISGCRSFSEFWESSFEMSAQHKSAHEFVQDVMALGMHMRELSGLMKRMVTVKLTCVKISKMHEKHTVEF